MGDDAIICLTDQCRASHSEAATEIESPRYFLPITQEFPSKLL
jgi:hypothetical protein